MAMRNHVGTASGLIGFFEDRYARRKARLDRLSSEGRAHPLHQLYADQALEDLQRVRGLVASMDLVPVPHASLMLGNTDLVPSKHAHFASQE